MVCQVIYKTIRVWFYYIICQILRVRLSKRGGGYVILVYVDEIVLASNNVDASKAFKNCHNNYLNIKDLGTLKYFLSVEVARGPKGIFLCQCKYAMQIIHKCGY